MNYYQEQIEIDSIIPARIYLGEPTGDSCHYALHWHHHLEFDLVLEGTITGRINRKTVEVPAGEFFFVNSGELHETDAVDRNTMRSVTILLSYHLLKEYCPEMDSYYFDFADNEAAKEQVKRCIGECADLYRRKEAFYELEISIALRQICSILLKDCRKAKEGLHYGKVEQKSLMSIKKAISYLEAHYDQDVSLHRIADEVGMAPTYFSRFFKRTTGQTFSCYLTKIRLYNAHKELIGSDGSMTEIALNNGFPNVKSFIESFKKEYRATPAQYKKRLAP